MAKRKAKRKPVTRSYGTREVEEKLDWSEIVMLSIIVLAIAFMAFGMGRYSYVRERDAMFAELKAVNDDQADRVRYLMARLATTEDDLKACREQRVNSEIVSQ